MKTNMILAIAISGLLLACASVPPVELVNARKAYKQASSGTAAQLVPAEVHKAHVALDLAEKSFEDDATSYQTRDLAYIADRKAKMAEALAGTVTEQATSAKADKEYASTQQEIVKNTKEEVADLERTAASRTEQLAVEQRARIDAENTNTRAGLEAKRVKDSTDAATLRTKETTDARARNAKAMSDAEALRVKGLADAEAKRMADQKARDDETILLLEKGKKVVLKGVTFETNKATLTYGSETILNSAYKALIANPEVSVEISGHTDNVGDDGYNQTLSLDRAQAVKNWLVQKGIASNRMKTVGKGEKEPVSSNSSGAGRAENRRIEFFVER